MKQILNELYQQKRLSKSESKQILMDIAAEKYNDAHFGFIYDGIYDASHYCE